MCSMKSVLKKFAILTGKHQCLRLLIQVAGLHADNLIKKRFQHRCFPFNIVNYLRTFILKNMCEGLLLYLVALN